MYEPIEYTLASGGKRLRPHLAIIAAEAVINGGLINSMDDVLPAALALEVFHNFTLVHDDVMDRAEVRRGQETVHRKWNNNTAILSGDQMLIEAYKLLAQVPAPKLPQVLKWFNEMATGVCEGQQYDMEFEARTDVTIDEYMEMIRLKTSVLLAGAARIGAVMGDADERNANALYDFAVNLGLAFQLQDDWLDVYGDPDVFGKAIGGDIMNNKKTYMLINAMQKAEGADKEELEFWLGNKSAYPGEKIAGVTGIYDRLDIGQICLDAVAEYSRKAVEALHSADLAPEAVAFFEAFDKMVMGRKK